MWGDENKLSPMNIPLGLPTDQTREVKQNFIQFIKETSRYVCF